MKDFFKNSSLLLVSTQLLPIRKKICFNYFRVLKKQNLYDVTHFLKLILEFYLNQRTFLKVEL